MAKLMHDVFNIDTGFHGSWISAFAKLNLEHVVDEVNDELLDPWADLQTKANISQSTPLSPFMEKELLRDMDLSLDGSAFEKETGFEYVKLLVPFEHTFSNPLTGTNTRSSRSTRSRR